MVKDYSGLSPRTVLGGVTLPADGGDQILSGSLWSPSQILQIDETINLLRQHEKSLNYSSIDQAVECLKLGLHHPTWQVNASECVEAIYNLSNELSTVEGQIHVIAQLLAHDETGNHFLEIISNLLHQADGSLLSDRLGEDGIRRLLDIAAQSNPKTQTNMLIVWDKVAIAPKLYDDPSKKEFVIDSYGSNDGPQYVGPIIVDVLLALSSNNAEKLAEILESSGLNPNLLARAVVDRLGDDARPAFQELALGSTNENVRQFAFDGLMLLVDANISPPDRSLANLIAERDYISEARNQSTIGNLSNESIDLSSLESILNDPGIIPSTLAARLGSSPAVYARLLELIVR